MPFEITITETREVKKLCGSVWTLVGDKEVERDSRYSSEGGPNTRIEAVYGYTPEIEKTVTETREVLRQTVDFLDLAGVIKAINKL